MPYGKLGYDYFLEFENPSDEEGSHPELPFEPKSPDSGDTEEIESPESPRPDTGLYN